MNLFKLVDSTMEQNCYPESYVFSNERENKMNFLSLENRFEKLDADCSKVLKLCYISLYALYHREKKKDFGYVESERDIMDPSISSYSKFSKDVIRMIWSELLELDENPNDENSLNESSTEEILFWNKFISFKEREKFIMNVIAHFKKNLLFQISAPKEIDDSLKEKILYYVFHNLIKAGVIRTADSNHGPLTFNFDFERKDVEFDPVHCLNYAFYLLSDTKDTNRFFFIGKESAFKMLRDLAIVSCMKYSFGASETYREERQYALQYLPFHLMEANRIEEAINLLNSSFFFRQRFSISNIRQISRWHGKDCMDLYFFMTYYNLKHAKENTATCFFAIIECIRNLEYEFKNGDFEISLSYLALTLEGLKWKNEAVLFYESVLHYQKAYCVSNCDIAFTLKQLGRAYADISSYDESLDCYYESLKIDRIQFGYHDANVASTCEKVAKINMLKGNYEHALLFFEELLIANCSLYGRISIEVALLQKDMGLLFFKQEKYKEALTYYEEALLVAKTVQENHEVIPMISFTIGKTCRKLGDHVKAIQYYDETLYFLHRYSGKRYKDIVEILKAKGNLCLEQEEYNVSIICFKKALTITNSFLRDEICPKLLKNLTEALQANGNFDEAISLYKKYLLNNKKLDNLKKSKMLVDFAMLHEKENNFGKAFDYYTKAVDLPEGAGLYIEVADKLKDLGDLSLAQNSINLAMKCFIKAKGLRIKKQGMHHIEVADLQHRLGTTFIKKGIYTKAEDYLLDSLSTRRLLLGNEHEFVGDLLHDLGIVKQMEKKYSESLNRFLEALAIRKKVLKESNIKVAETTHIIGVLMMKKEKFSAAHCYFKDALKIYRDIGLADNHFNIKDVEKCIIILREKSAKPELASESNKIIKCSRRSSTEHRISYIDLNAEDNMPFQCKRASIAA